MAGSAALFGTLGCVGGPLARDLGRDVDPNAWAEKAGYLGGVCGLGVLPFRALRVP